MNTRALRWAAGFGVLGAVMLGLGIRAAVGFHASKLDQQQSLTLGQAVDIITAAVLLILAALIVIGQLRARRRHTRHRQWVRDHQV